MPYNKIISHKDFISFLLHHEFQTIANGCKIFFINGDIQEEVFVDKHLGFTNPTFPNHVFKLKKALYGMK